MGYIKTVLIENKLGLILSSAAVSLSIIGARLEQHYAIMGMIAVVCLLIGLAVFDRIKSNFYPILIYVMSVSLLFQTSLLSSYLIGADIHNEACWANVSLLNGWDPQLLTLTNTSLPVTILVPFISRITGIDVVWVFKISLPFIFSLVPTLLFFLFKKWGTSKEAFLASTFFIVMPSFFLEVSAIAKQIFAEVGMALVLLVLFTDLRLKLKIPILVSSVALVVFSHYSVAIILGVFLLVGLMMKLILKPKMPTPTWVFGLLIAVTLVTGGIYYSRVASGLTIRYATALIPVPTQQVDLPLLAPITVGPIPEEERTEAILSPAIRYGRLPGKGLSVSDHSTLVRAGIGLDFLENPPPGRAFRILQYLTEISIVVGLIYLMKKRRKDFFIFGSTGVLILGLCIFWPGFSSILNASRFYHLTLFALAPAFVVGGRLLFRNIKVMSVCLLIPYLIFTSGFFFEAIHSERIDIPSIPFTAGLTNHRIDLGGSITKDDETVRDWLATQDEMIYGDVYGIFFLQERTGLKKDIAFLLNIIDPEETLADSYIFLRSRNQEERKVTQWNGIGLRRIYTYKEAGIDKMLEEREIVYQVGDSTVLGEASGTD